MASSYKYDVVLTFAGEDREYVEQVKSALVTAGTTLSARRGVAVTSWFMHAQVTGTEQAFSFSGSPVEGPMRLFGYVLIGLLITAAITIWLLVARSPFIQKDDMDQPSRVGQLYGYARLPDCGPYRCFHR